ncbi:telomere repeats-binding bouquet formation protein 2-like isoform X2 [Acanthochromis polyacanthus]|uniref:telomere repeats-binding bouquet formation protein 2 isoform X1 n=1 Tax=Acanthochromis polyacanthus TaxID=80966 RepID=UPI002234C254|nr:telomere repeats-binding bouquet formation protein 2 isoform X1 [Acanthochromis polyacanthus]XP_051800957.1 telomere repeats-binding bouquet formation protein 2-like isoform X2 [Acanthochromis polyacanthus]
MAAFPEPHSAVLEGGTVVSWRAADYLFSEDATCPDTLRIFDSKDYLWNKVMVFHSLFLSVCERRQSVKSVSIGHYVLPPASVQDEVRNVVGRLIWEYEDEQSEAQGSQKSSSLLTEEDYSEEISRSNSEPSETDSTESEGPLCNHLGNCPDSSMLTGYVSMDNLQKYRGELCDFQPEFVQCCKCKANIYITKAC